MNDATTKTRRQRAILSCNDCRRRKLKCDRLCPCNRCIRGGIAQSCAYGPEAHVTSSPDASQPPAKRRRRLPPVTDHSSETRVYKNLDYNLNLDGSEKTLLGSEDGFTPSEHTRTQLTQNDPTPFQQPKDSVEFLAQSPNLKAVDYHPDAPVGMLKGRSYGTFFYGSSSAMSIIAHFPELRNFMKEVYSTSTARRLSQDVKALEDRSRALKPFHRVLMVPKLKTLLPDRSTVDRLVHQYLTTFEITFRIIHIPTFQKCYTTYWEENLEVDTDMDALVLMILACTICTATLDNSRFTHNGSSSHTKAAIWIRACDVWSKRQSNKRKTLATLQVRCLRLLALAASSLKVKEYYQEVQAHLAMMRSGGMHRDPSIFGTRCSTFEGEMRRRLWATSMELELQASIDKGIASMLSNHDYDCAPPRNINDVDLTADLEILPQSQNASVFTDTSFLHCSVQSFDLRVRLCSLANNTKDVPSVQTLLDSEASLRRQLQSLPQWTSPESLQAHLLLELQLQQFNVILYTSKVLQSEARSDCDSRYFSIAAMEAAATTLDLHTRALQASNYALCLTRIDYFRAALSICRMTYNALEHKDTILSRFAKTVFEESTNNALRVHEERAMRPGRGLEYFWYLSAAVCLVGLKLEPSTVEKMTRQAIDRVAKLLYKQLSLQDEPSAESLASEVLLGGMANTTVHVDTGNNTIQELPPAESFNDAGLHLDAFDLGDVSSSWPFDDYWFFNDVLPLESNEDLQAGIF